MLTKLVTVLRRLLPHILGFLLIQLGTGVDGLCFASYVYTIVHH